MMEERLGLAESLLLRGEGAVETGVDPLRCVVFREPLPPFFFFLAQGAYGMIGDAASVLPATVMTSCRVHVLGLFVARFFHLPTHSLIT